MQKSEKKPYALMAGVCYGIKGLYNIITHITYALESDYAPITALNIIFWIAMLGMAVTLFLKNEKAIIAAAGVNALLDLYYFVHYFSLSGLLDFVAYASVVALLVFALKKNDVVQKVWFIAGAAMLLGRLIVWIDYGYFSYISESWKSILLGLIEIGGLTLLGLWIKEHDFVSAKAEPTNEYSTFDPQAVYSSPLSASAIGGADKLKMYKELLESGTITQEEFDAKKRQILKL